MLISSSPEQTNDRYLMFEHCELDLIDAKRKQFPGGGISSSTSYFTTTRMFLRGPMP